MYLYTCSMSSINNDLSLSHNFQFRYFFSLIFFSSTFSHSIFLPSIFFHSIFRPSIFFFSIFFHYFFLFRHFSFGQLTAHQIFTIYFCKVNIFTSKYIFYLAYFAFIQKNLLPILLISSKLQ